MNYPRKEKKTNVSQQETAVCVLHRQADQGLEFFMEKRPKEGNKILNLLDVNT